MQKPMKVETTHKHNHTNTNTNKHPHTHTQTLRHTHTHSSPLHHTCTQTKPTSVYKQKTWPEPPNLTKGFGRFALASLGLSVTLPGELLARGAPELWFQTQGLFGDAVLWCKQVGGTFLEVALFGVGFKGHEPGKDPFWVLEDNIYATWNSREQSNFCSRMVSTGECNAALYTNCSS